MPLARPLCNHESKSKSKVVHQNRLWLYTGANAPTWFEEQNTPSTHPMAMKSANAMAKPTAQADSELESTTNAVEQETLLRRSSWNRHPPLFYQA